MKIYFLISLDQTCQDNVGIAGGGSGGGFLQCILNARHGKSQESEYSTTYPEKLIDWFVEPKVPRW
jgi:hypothetical protein